MSKQDFRIGGIAENVEPQPVETPTEPVTTEPVDTPTKPAPTEPVATEPVEKPTEPKPTPVTTEPVATEPQSQPEPPKLSDEVQKFMNFQKENPELGMDDFVQLNKDWTKVADIDIIKENIKRQNANLTLSDSELTLLAGKQLGIDLSEGMDDLFDADKLAIKVAANTIRTSISEQKEKYSTLPDQPTDQPESSQAVAEMITLSNGMLVNKAEWQTARTKFETNIKADVAKLEKETFSFSHGSGDSKKDIALDYIIEEADRHRVLKAALNAPPYLVDKNVDAKGNFDRQGFLKDIIYTDTTLMKKMHEKMLAQAHAKGIEQVMKQEINADFRPNTPPKNDDKTNKPYVPRIDVVQPKLTGF